jgi:hypothetical protein
MPRLFGKNTSNPWLEQDRQNHRKVIITVVLLVVALLAGIGLLIYAVTHD